MTVRGGRHPQKMRLQPLSQSVLACHPAQYSEKIATIRALISPYIASTRTMTVRGGRHPQNRAFHGTGNDAGIKRIFPLPHSRAGENAV